MLGWIGIGLVVALVVWWLMLIVVGWLEIRFERRRMLHELRMERQHRDDTH